MTRWLKDMNFMFEWQEHSNMEYRKNITRISHSSAALIREIFLPLEHKILILSPPCNILSIFLTLNSQTALVKEVQ